MDVKVEAQKPFITTHARVHVLPSRNHGQPIQKPIAIPLRDHLCRHYLGKAENLTLPRGHLNHITLCVRNSYPKLLRYRRGEAIFGSSSRPASLHVYDITADSFVLELRNVPMSVATGNYIVELGGAIDEGQWHMTARLRLGATDALRVRALADLVRRAPSEGVIDKRAGCGYASFMAYQSLLQFAEVIEAFHPSAI
jgi:hypothetical protein